MSNDHVFKRARKYICAILMCVIGFSLMNTEACAQDSTSNLPTTIMSKLTATYKVDYIPPNTSLSAFSYQLIEQVRPFPNVFQGSKGFASYIAGFERVPNKDLSLGDNDEAAVLRRLKKLVGDIEFSAKKKSPDELAATDAARTLLYQAGGSKPTADYSQYLDFEKRYNAALDRLKSETSPAGIASIKLDLQRLQKDWELFGRRSEIEAALNTLKSDPEANDIYEDWIKSLDNVQAFAAESIKSALYKGEWTRFSLSDTELADIDSSLVADGKSVEMPRISRLSFDATLAPIRFPPLFHDFFENRYWRTISGYTVSDGISGADSNELMPRFISHLLIIKNCELTFDSKIPDSALKKMDGGTTLEISSLTVKSATTSGFSFQDQMVAVSSPIIIGYVVADVAKIPNPAVGNEWKSKE